MIQWTQEKEYLFALFSIFSCLILIYREFSPNTRLNYSKFTTDKKPGITIPSKYGMLIIYVPSLLISAYLFSTSHQDRLLLISFTSLIHYCKRVYEVLKVHRYSGSSKLVDNLSISMCYMFYVLVVYFFSTQVKSIHVARFWVGFGMFFLGEYINYYHHRILSELRKDGSKSYKIPCGGLFEYIWCPHYTGEIITFISIVFLSQHYIIFILQLGSAGYLAARAYHTRAWYKNKFDKIPQRACLLPGVF